MTTFQCNHCGKSWSMGPTRDLRLDETCHACLKEWLAQANERIDQLGNRINKMRGAVLEARSEGCACDWHLYGEDTELLTPEALDAYCTLEQRNTKLECEAITNEERRGHMEAHLAEREAWFEKCIAMWKEEEVLWKEREAELLATLELKWAGTPKPD